MRAGLAFVCISLLVISCYYGCRARLGSEALSHFDKAILLENVGDLDNALVQWERVYLILPHSMTALEKIGDIHLRKHRYDGAIRAYQGVVSGRSEGTCKVYIKIGKAYARSGRMAEACRSWRLCNLDAKDRVSTEALTLLQANCKGR